MHSILGLPNKYHSIIRKSGVYRAANLGEKLLLSIDGETESIESSSDSKAFDGQAWQRGVGVTLASL